MNWIGFILCFAMSTILYTVHVTYLTWQFWVLAILVAAFAAIGVER